MTALHLELGLARSDDAPALALLSRDLIEAGLGWQYRPQRIGAFIHDPNAVTLVARHHATPVGFAIMTFGDERAHLVLLAVRRPHQRQAIASRIIEWLFQSARVAGLTSVHVELRATNEPALAFYRAMGFSETFRVAGYYRGREAAVRMLRMLAQPSVERG